MRFVQPCCYSAITSGHGRSVQARLYEFIVRSFLATCSKPAVGFETRVEVDIAEELFDARGALAGTRCNAFWLLQVFRHGSGHSMCALSATAATTRTRKRAGLMVRERNWLDVYPYASWGGRDALPAFQEGQTFIPHELLLKDVRARAALEPGNHRLPAWRDMHK